MTETYSNRHEETLTIDRMDGHSVHFSNSTGCGAPSEVLPFLSVGKEIVLETQGLSLITGWKIDGVWRMRKSDETLAADHKAMVERFQKENLEHYEANKEKYDQWVAELPEWVDPKGEFKNPSSEWLSESMGFAYSLTAARLASLYAAMGPVILDEFEESDEIKEFHEVEGTSGNQAEWARFVARRHLKGENAS